MHGAGHEAASLLIGGCATFESQAASEKCVRMHARKPRELSSNACDGYVRKGASAAEVTEPVIEPPPCEELERRLERGFLGGAP